MPPLCTFMRRVVPVGTFTKINLLVPQSERISSQHHATNCQYGDNQRVHLIRLIELPVQDQPIGPRQSD